LDAIKQLKIPMA